MSDSVDARMVEAAARAIQRHNTQNPLYDQPPPHHVLMLAEAVVAALQPFRDAEQAETRRVAAEAAAELERAHAAIRRIYTTQVYEEPGNPARGLNVEFVSAMYHAAELCGYDPYRRLSGVRRDA